MAEKITTDLNQPPPMNPSIKSPTGPLSMGSGEFHEISQPIVLPASRAPWVVAGGAALVFGGLAAYFAYSGVGADAENVKLSSELSALKAEALTKDKRIQELEKDRQTLADAKAQQDAELGRMKATQEEITARVQSEIITGDISLTSDGSKLTVDLVDKLLFDSGSADITERGKAVLRKLGEALVKVEDRTIQVVGHTDDSPPTDKIKDKFPTNWELSAVRALNVVRFMQDEAKLPGKRLSAVGRGEHQPVASNAGPKGRARNRRIEILLTPTVIGK